MQLCRTFRLADVIIRENRHPSVENNMVRKAFTLIELLVVIAIIAILAAILFPVFAQAKEAAKKTQALSQAKQVGTAILLYTADYDDLGPVGNVPNLSGPTVRYYTTWQALHPNGWYASDPAANVDAEDALVWHNSSHPYMKNYDLILGPTNFKVSITGWETRYANPLKPVKGGNLTYNGLLQHWSFSAVENVSKLPMLWQGQGNLHRNGLAMANPRLNCNGTGPCVFNSTGMPQPDASGSTGDSFTAYGGVSYAPHSGTNIFISADSSARAVKMFGYGTPNAAAANSLGGIFRTVNSNGTITETGGGYSRIVCNQGTGTTPYQCQFRPDQTFAN
jgi:prepilin-type N-terminal cleavage/methylation domain-containing protein